MAFTTLSGATLTSLSGILKEYYLPPVVEQLNNDVLLLQRLDTATSEIYGKYVVVPVHTGRTGSIGARAEGAPLPDAGNQTYTNAHYDLTGLYGTVRATGLSIVKTSNDKGAFLQSLKSELDFIRNDLRKDLARQIYGTGDGVIQLCGTTTASNTVVLLSAEAVQKGQIYPGQLIDVGIVSNPQSVAAARTVVSVATNGLSFVISGATITTVSGTTAIFRAGPAGTSNVSAEINGLQNAVPTADNTFGTIDSTANPFWQVLKDATSGNLTMDRLMQAFNKVRQAGGQTSLLITSLGIQRGYFDLFTQTTKFTDPLTLQGGFETLTFMGKPVVADIDAPYGKLYLLDERFLKIFSNNDWHFLDEDGQTLHRNLGYDAYEATLARYMQFGLTRRNCQMVLSNVQVGGSADPGF